MNILKLKTLILLLILSIVALPCIGNVPNVTPSNNVLNKWAVTVKNAYVVSDIPSEFTRPIGAEIIPTPYAVRDKLKNDMYQAITKNSGNTDAENMILADMNGDTSSILLKINLTDQMDAYILHIDEIYFGNIYFVYLNRHDGTITQVPYTYSGTMMQNGENDFGKDARLPAVFPRFTLTDLTGSTQKEIAITERRHNGTVYDALVTHYVSYDSNLAIHELIAVETWSRLPFDDNAKRRMIHRTLTYDAALHEYVITSQLIDGNNQKEIGKAWLTGSGQNLRVDKKMVYENKLSDFLLTSYFDGENEFFKATIHN